MSTKYRQLVTQTFAGSDDHRQRSEWVEVDEEADVLACNERFDRSCVQVRPLTMLGVDLAGDADVRSLSVLVNDDLRIELLSSSGSSESAHETGDGWSEVHIQVGNRRTSRTTVGEFGLESSDLLVVPGGMSHESFDDEPSSRLIIRTRHPLKVAHGYPEGQPDTREEQGLIYLRPSAAAEAMDEGVSGGKHFELAGNDDIMIETTFRADDQRIYHKGYDQDEVHFQLSGRRATRTSQGEYMLETGDMLVIPPGVTHRNIGGMPTIRMVLYTKKPLQVADEYTARLESAWGK